MQIRDILQEKGTEVVTIEAGCTIHDAIGIITERDILRVCGEHCVRLDEPPAREEITCPSFVQDAMTKNRIRHLPMPGRRKPGGNHFNR